MDDQTARRRERAQIRACDAIANALRLPIKSTHGRSGCVWCWRICSCSTLLRCMFAARLAVRFMRSNRLTAATIKRVLDDHGRTPMPPAPAYQQVLKGMPAIDYTRDEADLPAAQSSHAQDIRIQSGRADRDDGQYRPASRAASAAVLHRGQHPGIAHRGSRRGTDQIRQFQENWDALLEGNTAPGVMPSSFPAR